MNDCGSVRHGLRGRALLQAHGTGTVELVDALIPRVSGITFDVLFSASTLFPIFDQSCYFGYNHGIYVHTRKVSRRFMRCNQTMAL